MNLWPFARRETRNADPAPVDPYLAGWPGYPSPWGGITPDGLLANSAVATRCVGLRAESLASSSLHVYRRTADGGRERATDHPLYGVLHDQMNPLATAYEGREFLIRSLDLHGNAYARIERDEAGQVNGLFPISPGLVSVERLDSGRLRYRVTDPRGGLIVLIQDEVLHIRGPSADGIMGQSPIQIARAAMAMRVTQAETAQNLVANGLRPSGVLSYDERLTGDARVKIRESVAGTVQGSANAGQLIIMDGGAKYTPLAWTAEDAEFIASQKLSNEDVARIFGVPPTSVGITDKATYSNTEQEGRALVQNCLGPLAGRVEAAMMRCLLTPDARRTLYVEHDLSSLLRGDVQARFEAYRIGREIGVFSPNDIRRRENETPIDGGDVYHQPANWTPLGSPAPLTGETANA